jgi:cAMP-dependent protein kinase regulator
VFVKGDPPTHLKVYVPGEAFGELALLYNAPRAASIRAKTDCILWVLDRGTFNHIVKDSAARKRESYEAFLGKIDLLEDMDAYEKSKIADAFKEVKFAAGDYVIREGEQGDTFYFLEEGEADATKVLTLGAEPTVVKSYASGEYFGELALLKGEPRAANIVAKTDLKCVTLDRHSFKRMLGPLEGILQRNADKYSKILQDLQGK